MFQLLLSCTQLVSFITSVIPTYTRIQASIIYLHVHAPLAIIPLVNLSFYVLTWHPPVVIGIVHLSPRLLVNYFPLSPIAPFVPSPPKSQPFSDFPGPNVHPIKAHLKPPPSIQNITYWEKSSLNASLALFSKVTLPTSEPKEGCQHIFASAFYNPIKEPNQQKLLFESNCLTLCAWMPSSNWAWSLVGTAQGSNSQCVLF